MIDSHLRRTGQGCPIDDTYAFALKVTPDERPMWRVGCVMVAVNLRPQNAAQRQFEPQQY
jgi:hypothetical protein